MGPNSVLEGARYETKYYLPPAVRTAIRCDLDVLMDRDRHQESGTDGYEVSTLYFDTPGRSGYIDKIEGVPHRIKFRIRQYGSEIETRRLEKKERIFDRHRKRRVVLSSDDYEALVSDRCPRSEDAVLSEFWRNRSRQALAPNLMIRYTRLAFVGRSEAGVRVTMDTNLHVRRASRLEDDRSHDVPALRRGETILELKWADAFPYWMQFLVRKYALRNVAISKYCLGVDALLARGAIFRG